MEDGILTDGQGRQVDFKNTIIAMTSNVGAQSIVSNRTAVGFSAAAKGEEQTGKIVTEELKKTFRPEFLNRVDDVIVFTKLSEAEIEKIAANMLASVASRTAELGVTLTWDEKALSHLAKTGYDPVYGARPLRRAIRSELEDALSEKILDKSVAFGDTVNATEDGGKLVLKKT